MADIFLSYTNRDLPRVRPLVAVFEEQGFSIWWDRRIPPGKAYPQVITENLVAARAVVVVWSRNSINSDWVQIEATRAKQRGILVPVTMDRLASDDIPLEFSLIQSAMLVDWDGKSQNEELDSLVTSVAALVSRSQCTETRRVDEPVAGRRWGSSIAACLKARDDVGAWRGRTGVFISYRRDDAAGDAGHLFDMLAAQFGEDSVFMDLDSIQVGVDFTSVMDDALAQSAVVLALIGPHWLSTRLDDPEDFVRTELAHALSADLPIIPVLVHDAIMPREEDLPTELVRLPAFGLSSFVMFHGSVT
jgi:hypothetical protein